jgi:glyoxylate reductase
LPERRVFLSLPVPERVEAALRESFELVDSPGGAEGIVTVPTDPVGPALFDAAGPQLRVVAQYAVGYDNVDLEAATERGIVVTNTPDVLTGAVAELTLGLILGLLRRIVEGDRLMRAREPWEWGPAAMLGEGLEGKTLGVVGFGRIGRETARLAEAFGMRAVHTSRTGGIPLRELLDQADVVSIHCPLTPETARLIGAEELRAMKPTAVVVNTSRGPIVDEAALVEALEAGEIAGAALDVYEREPDVHPGLVARDDVVLTPHVASATVAAREAMGILCVDALRAVLLEATVPSNALNPEALRSG